MPHEHLMQCIHDPILTGLSYLVAVLGSFTALQVAVAIPNARTAGHRRQAIFASSLALGTGAIWAMHFIAMLACRMDVPVTYDLSLTLISALIATVASMGGFTLMANSHFSWLRLWLAGTFMGLGVAGMHYTGMAAMMMPATISYDWRLVMASIAIAIIASTVALWLAFNLRGTAQMFGSALVMAVAVCGMHYVGMYAATFVPDGRDALLANVGGIGGEYLGMGLFAVTTILLTALLVVTLQRRRLRASVSI